MTTAPKATRFRIRREAPPAAVDDQPFDQGFDDGFGSEPFPTARGQGAAAPAPKATAAEIDAIKAEGLSGRQLRIARRLAMRHGIEAESDHDAVRLLRRKGLDPFQPAQLLALVQGANAPDEAGAGKPGQDAGGAPKAKTGQSVVTAPPKAPPPAPLTEGERAAEVMRIQRDIVRRRRRNFTMLMARLAAFVLLPTLVVGYYFFVMATPMYATHSEFVIQQAESQSSGIGSLFRGTQFATSQDSITVQSYLQSRDAMLRLDTDLGFKREFSEPGIDPIQRLPDGATNEQAYKTYTKYVKIGFDPTEGVIKMDVIAPDPHVSAAFSKALIGYAEEQVDALTQRMRNDQMQGARDSYADAEAKVTAAQEKILELQRKLGVLDPKSESSSIMTQINEFEGQLQMKRLQLRQLLDNQSPNQARVSGVEGDISRLQSLITELRAPLTETTNSDASLAQISGEMRMAEADLETRQLMLSQALEQLEAARIDANRQVRYLSLGVSPVAPDESSYPRAFEDTLLALLIFAAIYLLLSLTASILREQVTA
ncbi:MAG: capsule biosynthesis protein [Defluviimonas sp.]|uniref:capsule biosynthesis protein n=1 Tax=Albidovulum sp. TaxID=1872424 RepID=UPI001DF1F3B2|nr:capsule biosynthesis protein [Paracoccaceae bacterium]MCC0064642.1 capsule biosynthesis protein [Defluviimonas sp.]